MRIRTLIGQFRKFRKTAATLPSIRLFALYMLQPSITKNTTFNQLGLRKAQVAELTANGINTVGDALLWPAVAFRDLFHDGYVEAAMVSWIIASKFDFCHAPLGADPEPFIEHYGTLEAIPLPALVRHLFFDPDSTATVGDYIKARDEKRVGAFMGEHWGGLLEDGHQLIILEVEAFLDNAK